MADKRLILPRITKAKLDKQKKLKAFCESNRKTTHEFQIVNIRDKYADLLPDICPERFSYFRYVFCCQTYTLVSYIGVDILGFEWSA